MSARVPEDRGNGLTRVYDLEMNIWTYRMTLASATEVSGELVNYADVDVDDYVRLSLLKTMQEVINGELECINARLNIG